MVLQRLFKRLDFFFRYPRRDIGFLSEGEVGFGSGDEETCAPVHHLGDVEGFGEFFDFLVAVDDRLLKGYMSNSLKLTHDYA